MDYIDSISKRLWQLICYEKMPQKVEDELNRIHDTVNLIDGDITERLEEELSDAHSEATYWEEECENYTDLRRDNEELEEKIIAIEKHVVQLERDLRQYKKIGEQFSAGNKIAKLFKGASYPDMDWQNFQLDQYGNIVDSYDDYVDHYTAPAGDPLLDTAMRTMDRLVNAIEVGDTQPMQLAIARDVIYMLQDMRSLIENARESTKDARGLRQDLYASIDRENVNGIKIRDLEEKLKIVKDSDIKSMRKVINVIKSRSNNDKVESAESREPKITFDPEPSKWPGDGPLEEWEQPF